MIGRAFAGSPYICRAHFARSLLLRTPAIMADMVHGDMAEMAFEMVFVSVRTTIKTLSRLSNGVWWRVPAKQEERARNNETKPHTGSMGIYLPYVLQETYPDGYMKWKNINAKKVFFTRPTPTHTVAAHCAYDIKPNRRVELSAYSLMNRDLIWQETYGVDELLYGGHILESVRFSMMRRSQLHTSQRLVLIETNSNSVLHVSTKYIQPLKRFKLSHRVTGKTPMSIMPVLSKFKHKSFITHSL